MAKHQGASKYSGLIISQSRYRYIYVYTYALSYNPRKLVSKHYTIEQNSVYYIIVHVFEITYDNIPVGTSILFGYLMLV